MKDEEYRMQEYIKDYTNAHGNLPKSKGVDKAIHRINVGVKTLITIIIIIMVLMLIPILLYVYSKTEVFFTMNKDDFIKRIEKIYKNDIEIVEDYSSTKGNGNMVLKTKKEPYITFHSLKKYNDYYRLDFEENAFIYYLEKNDNPLFENIRVDREYRNYDEKNPDFKFLNCSIYINVDSYSDIETACRKRKELQEWMKDKINKFEVAINLDVKGYISYLWSYEDIETLIYKEKYQYYCYLRDNNKDMSEIPAQDIQGFK